VPGNPNLLKTGPGIPEVPGLFLLPQGASAMSDEGLIIFDTTLRDGEQSPGASSAARGRRNMTREHSTGFPARRVGVHQEVIP
jgi:hypothetical protein